MPLSVRNIITNALITCDAIAIGETPEDTEIFRGLLKFNQIVSQLALDNMWAYTYNRTNYSLVGGQDVYTIGNSGGTDIVAPRPTEIVRIQLNNGGVWYSLEQYSEVEFANRTKLADTSGVPVCFVYHSDFPDGEIELYPKPSNSYDIRIQTRDMVTEYTLDDTLDLPPGYTGYLEYALASILAVDYGSDPTALLSIATTRLANIKRQNVQPRKLRFEIGTEEGSYDINTDTFIGGS